MSEPEERPIKLILGDMISRLAEQRAVIIDLEKRLIDACEKLCAAMERAAACPEEWDTRG